MGGLATSASRTFKEVMHIFLCWVRKGRWNSWTSLQRKVRATLSALRDVPSEASCSEPRKSSPLKGEYYVFLTTLVNISKSWSVIFVTPGFLYFDAHLCELFSLKIEISNRKHFFQTESDTICPNVTPKSANFTKELNFWRSSIK